MVIILTITHCACYCAFGALCAKWKLSTHKALLLLLLMAAAEAAEDVLKTINH
jgi:hypothetical protein